MQQNKMQKQHNKNKYNKQEVERQKKSKSQQQQKHQQLQQSTHLPLTTSINVFSSLQNLSLSQQNSYVSDNDSIIDVKDGENQKNKSNNKRNSNNNSKNSNYHHPQFQHQHQHQYQQQQQKLLYQNLQECSPKPSEYFPYNKREPQQSSSQLFNDSNFILEPKIVNKLKSRQREHRNRISPYYVIPQLSPNLQAIGTTAIVTNNCQKKSNRQYKVPSRQAPSPPLKLKIRPRNISYSLNEKNYSPWSNRKRRVSITKNQPLIGADDDVGNEVIGSNIKKCGDSQKDIGKDKKRQKQQQRQHHHQGLGSSGLIQLQEVLMIDNDDNNHLNKDNAKKHQHQQQRQQRSKQTYLLTNKSQISNKSPQHIKHDDNSPKNNYNPNFLLNNLSQQNKLHQFLQKIHINKNRDKYHNNEQQIRHNKECNKYIKKQQFLNNKNNNNNNNIVHQLNSNHLNTHSLLQKNNSSSDIICCEQFKFNKTATDNNKFTPPPYQLQRKGLVLLNLTEKQLQKYLDVEEKRTAIIRQQYQQQKLQQKLQQQQQQQEQQQQQQQQQQQVQQHKTRPIPKPKPHPNSHYSAPKSSPKSSSIPAYLKPQLQNHQQMSRNLIILRNRTVPTAFVPHQTLKSKKKPLSNTMANMLNVSNTAYGGQGQGQGYDKQTSLLSPQKQSSSSSQHKSLAIIHDFQNHQIEKLQLQQQYSSGQQHRLQQQQQQQRMYKTTATTKRASFGYNVPLTTTTTTMPIPHRRCSEQYTSNNDKNLLSPIQLIQMKNSKNNSLLKHSPLIQQHCTKHNRSKTYGNDDSDAGFGVDCVGGDDSHNLTIKMSTILPTYCTPSMPTSSNNTTPVYANSAIKYMKLKQKRSLRIKSMATQQDQNSGVGRNRSWGVSGKKNANNNSNKIMGTTFNSNDIHQQPQQLYHKHQQQSSGEYLYQTFFKSKRWANNFNITKTLKFHNKKSFQDSFRNIVNKGKEQRGD